MMKAFFIAAVLALAGCAVEPTRPNGMPAHHVDPRYLVGCKDQKITVLIDADMAGRLELAIDPDFCSEKDI
jgi:hypothetical protein